MLRIGGTAFFLMTAAVSALAAPAPSVTTQLPRGVAPLHYDVTLTPDAAALRFDGSVRIDIEVAAPTREIVLNAADLDIARSSLSAPGGKQLTPTVAVDAKAQTARFGFAAPLAPGRYTLVIDYRGQIGTQAAGLFALDYDANGDNRRALFTQFENSDARRVLPSWDEPSYKATFTLSAIVPDDQTAVGNMPVASETALGNGRKRVQFAATPKMSSYLLFFGLGDFERRARTVDGVDIGVVTKRGSLDQAGFALDASAAIVPWFNRYFGVPFPLPKLDNVAAPGRSAFFDAMENWGAILTFEGTLLLDPAISTENERRSIFDTAAHEIAHQWFGNIVTMAWWDDLWLNEGFASWLQGRTTQHFHPEWRHDLDAVSYKSIAMQLDARSSTHPIVQKIATVEQASLAFDTITYLKGGAVLDMLEGYTGAEAWRAGVQRYIREHAYGNTVTDDLWRAVEQSAGKPILAIAHDFTLQPGVPLIRVTAAKCSAGRTTVELEQDEFTSDRQGKPPLRWRVPVDVRVIGGGNATTLVENGRASLSVDGCGPVVVNANQTGYYRTAYTPQLFSELASHFAELPDIGQFGLIEDSWALGMAGTAPIADSLDLIAALPADTNAKLLRRAALLIATLDQFAHGDAAFAADLRSFAKRRFAPRLAELGWTPRDGETSNDLELRTALIDVLGKLGDPEVLAEARRRYQLSKSDPSAMPGALRQVILGVVARHADEATWQRLRADASAEKSDFARQQLYALLAKVEDPTLAARALDLAMSGEAGTTNASQLISTVGVLHPELAFDFALSNLDALNKVIDRTARNEYVPHLVWNSLEPAMLGRLQAYADANIDASARAETNAALARMRERQLIKAERMPAVARWLAAQRG